MTRSTINLPVLEGTPPQARPAFALPESARTQPHRFHTMIKPTGAACNLDCSYCFYLHKTDLLGHGHASRMTEEVLEEHIRQYIEGQSGEEVVFSWQGASPR